MPSLRISLLGVLFAGAMAAQEGLVAMRKAGPDPYTGGDAAVMKAAGYVSFGPFPLGHDHSTEAVESLLGDEPLIWIETAHFRLGCALSRVVLKGEEEWLPDWVRSVREELKRLKKRIPKVKVDVKELDPWLRAHLMAQRLEDLYAEVQGVLGVTDASFPAVPGDDPTDPGRFRGLGPYLGMPEKFRVLLLRKAASQARYTSAYQGIEMTDPVRYHDIKLGAVFWSGSEETAGGLFGYDLALHANLTFNVAHNLYSGYRSWSFDLPAWLPTGLGHWHARRVSPRFPAYDRKDDKDKDPRSPFWAWDTRVRGLMKNGVFEPLSTLFERGNAGEFGLEQHMQAWAFVDFLMQRYKDRLPRFLSELKVPFHYRRKLPTAMELSARQKDVMQAILDKDAEALQIEWRDFLLARAKRR